MADINRTKNKCKQKFEKRLGMIYNNNGERVSTSSLVGKNNKEDKNINFNNIIKNTQKLNNNKIYSIDETHRIKNKELGNELLVNQMEKIKKTINLKALFKKKNDILSEKKVIKHNLNYIIFNSNNKKCQLNNKRINSAQPLILDCNKNVKDLKKIINLKLFNNNYDSKSKILAFKENIFVYNKNISLLIPNQNNNDIIGQYNINNNNNHIDSNNTIINQSKNKNNQKFQRPKSALYGQQKYNLIINKCQSNDISFKNTGNNIKDNIINHKNPYTIFDDKYYDLSYINNIL